MRILHVVPTYMPAWRQGGPIRAVHGLCKALARRGHDVTVFTTDIDIGPELPRGRAVALDGVEVWYFAARSPRRLHWAPSMRGALRQKTVDVDVVHLHSLFLWPTMAAARAAEHAGVPYLVAPRGMLVRDLLLRRGRLRKTLWMRFVERRTLARAAALHVTSQLEAAEAQAIGVLLPRVLLVPNGVDAPHSQRGGAPSAIVQTLLERQPLLLFLGRVNWKKGLDRLVRALPEVPGATLAVAGNDEEGYRQILEALCQEHGVADRVVFCGPVDGADKAALLSGAVALILPSYSENFGNVVLESMAAGRPVVVTPEVGLADVVRESGAGLVADGDSASLGAALRQLLEDPAAADDMGRRGEAAARGFGWDTIAAEMEQGYLSVIGGRP